ncbi:hypothetical protein BUALT_Bualt11G0063200 [Buddleja alternifolia]|uniref:Auxin-responsive protein n=1 Tax=Buddleja alternifolia TaxID=168488 RepID=A0AAV6X104_9LAMI|nr:hypothetical protein BUALT_Bualt11G0063200 [Buddleja alternifolia]
MSPPLLGVEGKSQCNVSLVASSASADCVSQNGSGLKERNYLGLSDCSSVDSSAVSKVPEGNKSNLNLRATELRLGLPGSQSPERDSDFSLLSSAKIDEKQLFPLIPSKDGICSLSQKTVVSGNKRGFADTVDGFSDSKNTIFSEGNWMFNAAGPDSGQPKLAGNAGVMLSNKSSGTQPPIKTEVPAKTSKECNNTMNGSNTNSAPAAKAQVVGWPPIRSFRKNTLVTTSKNNDEVDGKPGPGALFIKVSMDGAPYLRKVDLRTYSSYQELSSALEKMFSCFTIGQCGPQGGTNKEMMSDSKLRDLLHGSEYVLTYEDKDGDWMLVGDVPWEMFIGSCKRLKIMKGSDAIGLDDYSIIIPSLEDLAHRPPPQHACFHVALLRAGLWFSIAPLFISIANRYSIPLNQFAPNVIRMMARFSVLLHFYGIEPTTEFFYSLFHPCSSVADSGVFYLTSRCPAIILAGHPGDKRWKDNFFYIAPQLERLMELAHSREFVNRRKQCPPSEEPALPPPPPPVTPQDAPSTVLTSPPLRSG